MRKYEKAYRELRRSLHDHISSLVEPPLSETLPLYGGVGWGPDIQSDVRDAYNRATIDPHAPQYQDFALDFDWVDEMAVLGDFDEEVGLVA